MRLSGGVRRSGGKRRGFGVQEPLDAAVLQGPAPEVQEEPDALSGKAQISEQLSAVEVSQVIHRLELQHNEILHQQIQSVGTWNDHASVRNVDRDLPLNTKPG